MIFPVIYFFLIFFTFLAELIKFKILKKLDEEMTKVIKAKGWKKLDDNFVFVANHEENIKTKNIVEKIKFDGKFFNYFCIFYVGILLIFFSFVSTHLDVSSVMAAGIKL